MSVVYKHRKTNPWAFLNEYRGAGKNGVSFKGQWPTIPEMFKITVSRYSERNCFTIFDPDRITLTYKESLSKIEAAARWLYSKGIRKGDKVAVSGKNSPEWAVAYLGVLSMGGTVVPLDYQLKNEEMDLLLKTSCAKIFFVDEEKYPYYTENPRDLEAVVSLKKGTGEYIYSLDGQDADFEEIDEFDIAAILFTSGTTGKPKGVMLTHQNLVSDC